jgi:serine/threonine protein phosphatase PrpC
MALFTNNSSDSTHSLTISSSLNQLCKGQDYIYIDDISVLVNEECTVCIIFDGHGGDSVINFIRSIPNNKMNKLITKSNPIETLSNYINNNILSNYT